MFKNNDLKVEFFSSHPYLNEIPECRPAPLSKFIPEWWSKFRPNDLGINKTIKDCPSFPEMFSSAYVVPMWADTKITVDENGNGYADVANNEFSWTFHHPNQFLNFAPKNIKEKVSAILKPDCPWHMITPKGYSTYQAGSFYHFNENFDIMSGIIRTDIHHEINQQVLVTSKPGTFTIKRGDPFAVYFPFKRDKFSLETRAANDDDWKKFQIAKTWLFTKFSGGYVEMVKHYDGK